MFGLFVVHDMIVTVVDYQAYQAGAGKASGSRGLALGDVIKALLLRLWKDRWSARHSVRGR